MTIYITPGMTPVTVAVGMQGPSGPAVGNDATHEHVQTVPSAVWTVTHNLGKVPAVTLLDTTGREFDASVRHLSPNQYEVRLSVAIAGRAISN